MKNDKVLPAGPAAARQLTQPLHLSPEDYLIVYCQSGTVKLTAGSFSALYGRDGFLLLPPGHEASAEPSPEAFLLTIPVSKVFVQDHLDYVSLPVISSESEPQVDMRQLKKLILDLSGLLLGSPEDENDLAVTGVLFLILAELRRLPGYIISPSGDRKFRERKLELSNYISLHCAEPLTLTGLAEEFFLTPQYLSTFFQKQFGVNFKTYLNERRLFLSLRDLRHTQLSISEIALRNGFSSISAYRRNFEKAYGCTPSDFRAAYRAEQKESAASSPFGSPLPEDSDSEAAEIKPADEKVSRLSSIAVPLRIRADLSPARHKQVHQAVNIGSVQNLLSENFRAKLLDFTAKTGIRCVRMQGLLSASFIPMVLPHYEYYYLNVDNTLSFLYEHGLYPFIELSKLPVSSDSSGDIYTPRGHRFLKLLESLLLHVTRRWPDSWLEKWRFELWMIPRDTPQTYVRDFCEIHRLITSFIPGAEVGGPGWTPGSSSCDLKNFLKTVKESDARMSFASVSLNYQTDISGSSSVSVNEDYLEETLGTIRRELDASGLRLPLYVTEWTSVCLRGFPVTCSRYQAAFILKTFFMLDHACDLAAYWLFCDTRLNSGNISSESPMVFGDGLLSPGFLPYAPYYAWLFAAGLGSQVISEGSFHRFTKLGEDHYRLLVWHYEHFRTGTEAALRSALDFDSVYSLFRESPDIDIQILVDGLPRGLYHISRLVLGEFSGSLLDIMIGEYSHSNIDKFDFLQNLQVLSGFGNSYRLESCVPEERSSYTKVEDVLATHALLPSHTICLWDIRRQR